MMKTLASISKKLSFSVSENEKYSRSDIAEIIEYMLTRIILNFIWIISVIYIARMLNLGAYVYAFMGVYTVVRSRFGGFHLKSTNLCLMCSIIAPVIIGLLIKHFSFPARSIILVYCFAFMVLFKRGVVDNENKPLTNIQKEKFKKEWS